MSVRVSMAWHGVRLLNTSVCACISCVAVLPYGTWRRQQYICIHSVLLLLLLQQQQLLPVLADVQH